MWVYAKNALLDCLLCIVVSSALSFTLCSGFYATQPYQDLMGTLQIIGVCAAITVVLFAISMNRMAMLIGALGLAVALAVVFGASIATSGMAAPLDDQVGNRFYFALCTLAPPIVVYLLSRTRVSTVVLIVLGVVLCGVIEYLYWYGHVIAFFVFLVGAVALLAYRTYQASLMKSESDYLAFGSVTVAGMALALVAVLAGAGVFAAVIAPFDPPHLVMKLITEHYRAEEVEVRGIGSTDDALDKDQQSDQLDDQNIQTDDLNGDVLDDDAHAGGSNENASLGLSDNTNPVSSMGAGLAGLLMHLPRWTPFALIALVVLLVLAVIFAKKALRRRRFNAMMARGPDDAATELYRFFLKRFERFKIAPPGALTLPEYVTANASAFNAFEQGTDQPEFSALTDVYMRQVYGNEQVTEDELGLFVGYYERFYKRACAYLGRLRYCRVFFLV